MGVRWSELAEDEELHEVQSNESVLVSNFFLLGLLRRMDDVTVTNFAACSSALRRCVLEWCSNRTVHGLFRRVCKRFPQRAALLALDGSCVLSCGELWNRSECVAKHLSKEGVKLNDPRPVGVVWNENRSGATMLALFLGIAMHGHPFAAIKENDNRFNPLCCFVFHSSDGGYGTDTHLPLNLVLPSQNFALVQSSGTTIKSRSESGKEKCEDNEMKKNGVFLSHDNVMHRFRWMWQTYPFLDDECCLRRTSWSFVDSLWESFGPLCRGVPLVDLPLRLSLDVVSVANALESLRITRAIASPAFWRLLVLACPFKVFPNLHCVTVSGDAVSVELAQGLRRVLSPNACLLNLYGTAEVCGDASVFEIDALLSHCIADIPIGRPIPNVEIAIRSDGEVTISGPTLGTLVDSDWKPVPDQSCVFRTGDLALLGDDGLLHYLGRRDFLAKHHEGKSINVTQVEQRVMQSGLVHDCCVVLIEKGWKMMVCVVTPANAPTKAVKEIGDRVVDQVIAVSSLPLTPNMKVDRRAVCALAEEILLSRRGNARKSDQAQLCVAAYGDVLEIRSVNGLSENFFLLGGNSYKLVSLFQRCGVLLNEQNVSKFLQQPYLQTIQELSNVDVELLMNVAEEWRTSKEEFDVRAICDLSSDDRKILAALVVDTFLKEEPVMKWLGSLSWEERSRFKVFVESLIQRCCDVKPCISFVAHSSYTGAVVGFSLNVASKGIEQGFGWTEAVREIKNRVGATVSALGRGKLPEAVQIASIVTTLWSRYKDESDWMEQEDSGKTVTMLMNGGSQFEAVRRADEAAILNSNACRRFVTLCTNSGSLAIAASLGFKERVVETVHLENGTVYRLTVLDKDIFRDSSALVEMLRIDPVKVVQDNRLMALFAGLPVNRLVENVQIFAYENEKRELDGAIAFDALLGEIILLAVSRKFRRCGVGSVLVSFALRNISNSSVFCRCNEAAFRFWEHAGFVRCLGGLFNNVVALPGKEEMMVLTRHNENVSYHCL
jgi:acyl-CoA synthetase (AMP-forming)/AMP-acid ligase II/GNAT superfamily N-acetyltransferase